MEQIQCRTGVWIVASFTRPRHSRHWIIDSIITHIEWMGVIEQIQCQTGVVLSFQSEAIKRLGSLDLIGRNFVQLNVLFERINPYQMVDKQSFTPDGLMAQIGGVFSLWLGMTIMNIVEVVECFVMFIQNARKVKQTKETNGNTQDCSGVQSTATWEHSLRTRA